MVHFLVNPLSYFIPIWTLCLLNESLHVYGQFLLEPLLIQFLLSELSNKDELIFEAAVICKIVD